MHRVQSAVTVAALFCLALPAFAGKRAELAALKANSDSAHSAYTGCMEEAGHAYSTTDAQPRDVADAAQSKCSESYYAFESSVQTYLLAVAGRAFLADQARSQARSLASEVREKAKGRVVEIILDARLNKSAP